MPSDRDISIRASSITTPGQLAIIAEVAIQQPQLRRVVDEAARRLGEPTLNWRELDSKPPPQRPAPSEPTREPLTLDSPAHALFADPSRRADLHTVIRTIALATGDSYPDALTRAQETWEDLREAAGTGPVTLRRVLGGAGVKHRQLDGALTDMRTLEARDDRARQLLSQAAQPLSAERLDSRGRVLLDSGFDVPALLHDPEARERRWREARKLDRAYQDRSRWEEDDALHLESGLDLLATLTRPVLLAEARRRADSAIRMLDAAIHAAEGPDSRARALDAAPFDAHLSLDAAAPDASAAAGLGQLDSPQLSAAVNGYRQGLSLSAAVAQATAPHPTAAPAGGFPERAELAARMRQLQSADPDLDVLTALERACGLRFGP